MAIRIAPIALGLAALALTPALAPAQEPVDLGLIGRLRTEGFRNSKVMETIWFLTDRYGPRLTNSPMQFQASEWAVERLTEFGLENARQEPWGEFGLGWSFERCVVAMTEPSYMPMVAIPKAWTSGTRGRVLGIPVLIEAESVEELEQYRGKLEGKIVLNGQVSSTETPFEPLAQRHDAESLAELEAAPELDESERDSSRFADFRRRREVRNALQEMLKEEGALVVIEPDGGRRGDYGVITLGSGGSRAPDGERAMPQVVVSTEQFNRVARLLQRGVAVELAADVRTTFHAGRTTGYNVVAEIPGSDPLLRDEVVMLGAHFDSWHPATGATDNGASCAVVMEAARLLLAVDARPRRTIRVALWTGEEQGLLGSRGYVTKHFADRDTMELLPEHDGLAAYFNLDNGAGKIRGVYLQQNTAVRPIFEAWLEPFHDLGATTLALRNTGGTDHQSYDGVGLPGFQFIQEPMDYSTRTHHTNMDTYERVHAVDVQQSAIVMASFAYHAATRDERLPRKPLPEPRRRPEAAAGAGPTSRTGPAAAGEAVEASAPKAKVTREF